MAPALEELFKLADADGDGRVGGAEAVAFFSRADLPQLVLAQVCMLGEMEYIYIYVCVCVCMCVCICVFVMGGGARAHVYICIYEYVLICTRVCVYVCVCMWTMMLVKQIWQLVDDTEAGSLGVHQFSVALKLVSLAQQHGGQLPAIAEVRTVMSGGGATLPPPLLKGVNDQKSAQPAQPPPPAGGGFETSFETSFDEPTAPPAAAQAQPPPPQPVAQMPPSAGFATTFETSFDTTPATVAVPAAAAAAPPPPPVAAPVAASTATSAGFATSFETSFDEPAPPAAPVAAAAAPVAAAATPAPVGFSTSFGDDPFGGDAFGGGGADFGAPTTVPTETPAPLPADSFSVAPVATGTADNSTTSSSMGFGFDDAFGGGDGASAITAPVPVVTQQQPPVPVPAPPTAVPTADPAPAPTAAVAVSPMTGGGGGGGGAEWQPMSEDDSKRYDMLFAQTDTNHDGVVTGQECFPVFMQWVPLGLPQDALKEVWDLVAGQNAHLTQHDFKTCLYLMESLLKGTIAALPSALPPQPFPPPPAAPAMVEPAAPVPVQQPVAAAAVAPPMPPAQFESTPMPPMPPAPADVFGAATASAESQFARTSDLPPVPVVNSAVTSTIPGEEKRQYDSLVQSAQSVSDQVADSVFSEKVDHSSSEFVNKAMADLVLFKSKGELKLMETREKAEAAKSELDAAKREYEVAFGNAQSMNSEIGRHVEAYKAACQSRDKLKEEIAALTVESDPSSVQRETQAVETEIGQLTLERNTLQASLKSRRGSITALKQNIDEGKIMTEAVKLEIEAANKSLNELHSSINFGTTDRAEAGRYLSGVQELIEMAQQMASRTGLPFASGSAGGWDMSGAADHVPKEFTDDGFIVVDSSHKTASNGSFNETTTTAAMPPAPTPVSGGVVMDPIGDGFQNVLPLPSGFENASGAGSTGSTTTTDMFSAQVPVCMPPPLSTSEAPVSAPAAPQPPAVPPAPVAQEFQEDAFGSSGVSGFGDPEPSPFAPAESLQQETQSAPADPFDSLSGFSTASSGDGASAPVVAPPPAPLEPEQKNAVPVVVAPPPVSEPAVLPEKTTESSPFDFGGGGFGEESFATTTARSEAEVAPIGTTTTATAPSSDLDSSRGREISKIPSDAFAFNDDAFGMPSSAPAGTAPSMPPPQPAIPEASAGVSEGLGGFGEDAFGATSASSATGGAAILPPQPAAPAAPVAPVANAFGGDAFGGDTFGAAAAAPSNPAEPPQPTTTTTEMGFGESAFGTLMGDPFSS